MENKELKERFIDEKTGIEYLRSNLVLEKSSSYSSLCNPKLH